MKIFKINDNFTNIPKIKKEINLCLGYFDGVHLGHQKLIKLAVKNANENYIKVGVVTFNGKIKNNKNIINFEKKMFFFKLLKVDYVFIIPFNEKIKNLTHEKFKIYFIDKIKLKNIFVGKDFTFGKNKIGNVFFLKKYYSIKIITFVKKDKYKISSSEIKKMIQNGFIKKVNQCLGRQFEIDGKIIKYSFDCNQRIKIDIIVLDKNIILPKNGIYKTKIFFNKKWYISISRIKKNKRFNKIEEFIFKKFKKNEKINNQDVKIKFITKIN